MKKRILIVDDDPDILDSLRELLEASYEVRVARDGREALDIVARELIDAVILDMMMPVLSGEGFLEESNRRGVPRPTIVITARSDVQERVRKLGAADYLLKPFAMSRLEEKLARLLGPDGDGPQRGPTPDGVRPPPGVRGDDRDGARDGHPRARRDPLAA